MNFKNTIFQKPSGANIFSKPSTDSQNKPIQMQQESKPKTNINTGRNIFQQTNKEQQPTKPITSTIGQSKNIFSNTPSNIMVTESKTNIPQPSKPVDIFAQNPNQPKQSIFGGVDSKPKNIFSSSMYDSFNSIGGSSFNPQNIFGDKNELKNIKNIQKEKENINLVSMDEEMEMSIDAIEESQPMNNTNNMNSVNFQSESNFNFSNTNNKVDKLNLMTNAINKAEIKIQEKPKEKNEAQAKRTVNSLEDLEENVRVSFGIPRII